MAENAITLINRVLKAQEERCVLFKQLEESTKQTITVTVDTFKDVKTSFEQKCAALVTKFNALNEEVRLVATLAEKAIEDMGEDKNQNTEVMQNGDERSQLTNVFKELCSSIRALRELERKHFAAVMTRHGYDQTRLMERRLERVNSDEELDDIDMDDDSNMRAVVRNNVINLRVEISDVVQELCVLKNEI